LVRFLSPMDGGFQSFDGGLFHFQTLTELGRDQFKQRGKILKRVKRQIQYLRF